MGTPDTARSTGQKEGQGAGGKHRSCGKLFQEKKATCFLSLDTISA